MSVFDKKIDIIKDVASRYFDSKESCFVDCKDGYPSLPISIRGIINGNRVDLLYNLSSNLLHFPIQMFEQIMIREIDYFFINFDKSQ